MAFERIPSDLLPDVLAEAIKNGVPGDILYRGETDWSLLPKGTARQTLRMNASADAPEWVVGWEPVYFQIVSAQASVPILNLSPFYAIRLTTLLVMSEAASCAVQISEDNGSNWLASTLYHQLTISNTHTTPTPAGAFASAGFLIAPANSTPTNAVQYSRMELFGFNKATGAAGHIEAQDHTAGTTLGNKTSGIYHATSVARNAIRLLPSSGTISGGILLEGLRG